MRNVNPDPATLQPLGNGDRGSASAERVKHKIAFAAARLDDPLKQRFRLLRWIAKTLLLETGDDREIPHITMRQPFRFLLKGDLARLGLWVEHLRLALEPLGVARTVRLVFDVEDLRTVRRP